MAARIRKVTGHRSIRDLEALLGFNRETIRRYQRGDTPATAAFLAKLCEVLNADPAWLLLGDETFTVPRNP